ncbi:kinase-like domain-containing protein [Gigaspora rosea]|uniref:Kinase-like domain-containing protein n=1 Tax=Gigaspora rosea TaxID=44941 RepID=A0A397UEL1_9GLOM|nr:kinase-like domain-containing protein [Gigaspora rosea]
MFKFIKRKFIRNKSSFKDPEKVKRDSSRYNEWIKNSDIPIIDQSELYKVKEIGKGGHGTVYSAEHRGEMIVYKEIKDNKIRKFVNEVKQHMTVNENDNIIKFKGIILSSGKYMIVLQYANGGTLEKYLKNKISDDIYEISWTELIPIVEQIIFGLQHLHEKNIAHGDLHPKNILVINDDNDRFNKVVISDFGSASKLDDSLISIHGKYLTIEYADPQFFINPQMIEPNFKSDIYSLGVILWELTSGIRPFSEVLNKIALPNHILKGKREKKVSGTPSRYVKLYKRCWSSNPKKRPEIKEILCKLRKSKDEKIIISNKVRGYGGNEVNFRYKP